MQQLPGLVRDPHPDYDLAVNQTWKWFCRNFLTFKEDPPSLEESLMIWINEQLHLEIDNLYKREQILAELLEQARYPDLSPSERRRVLHRLLVCVQQLPGLLRDPHLDYRLALNQTFEWFCRNLSQFEARPPSLEKSLVTWLNGYLRFRIRDLYIRDGEKWQRFESLDAPIGCDRDDIRTLQDKLADSRPSLSDLNEYLEALQQENRQQFGQQIREYIEQDPEGLLAGCHLRNNDQCNCQLLSKRLLLQEPPDRRSNLAREFGVPYPTLDSHWKYKCLPLLRKIIHRLEHEIE
ncbi:MAG: hypothetical protein AAFY11_15905 [Cyanobacteria bacterium J06641_5]